ncbi:MAG TPA: hypothetical protein VJ953_15140 [Saprospiraceae bacterium]|nr:hypothetical protein [Saprospiraceae bacterium]
MSINQGIFSSIAIYISIFSLVLVSCQSDAGKDIPEVEGIEVDVELRRFEQDLFSLDTNTLEADLAELQAAYPLFSELYFQQIVPAKRAPQGFVEFIKGFITFPQIRSLYDTTQVLYGDLSAYQQDLEQAFRFYKYYFPERSTPQVTTYISEYAIGAFIYGEDQLAVGLDFFLGANYPYGRYNPGNPNFSNYLIRTFNRAHLPMKTLKPLVEDIVGTTKEGRLLDMMIQEGKELYLMDHLLPYTADSIILEMPEEDVQWLEDNELEVWAYLLKEQLFYESDWKKIRKFVEYSPNIPQMHPEAPGRTANWVGWQVIKAYMKNNPELDMVDLMAETNAQQILDRSRYKPPRR